MSNRTVITAVVSAVLGGAAGSAVTYFVVKKKFAARAQADIDDVKQAYKERFEGMRVVPDYVEGSNIDVNKIKTMTAEERAAAEKFVADLGYGNVAKEPDFDPNEEQTEIDRAQSIYDRTEEPPADVVEITDIRMRDYDLEGRKRTKQPFIISADEFDNTKVNEWDKIPLTYYEDEDGDILTDDNDRPVDDTDYLVGDDHLNLFGVLSGEANKVYVRNTNLSSDFEITRIVGSYSELVWGVSSGSEQIGTPRNARMRMGDDD